jgi:membrane protease YdiL (CAAX protease family)
LAIDLGIVVISSGAIIAAIIFGLVHAMPAKMMGKSISRLVVAAFILGLVAGVGLSSSGSLVVPVVIHIIFNTVGLVMSIRNEEIYHR